MFEAEVHDIVLNGIKNNVQHENLMVDINSRKFAFDKNFLDCARAILLAMLDSVDSSINDPKPLYQQIKIVIANWTPLLSNFITSEVDQTELVWYLQEFCDTTRYEKIFPNILGDFYNTDLIEKKAIFGWRNELSKTKSEERRFLDLSSKLLTMLEETESEEEEDSEE